MIQLDHQVFLFGVVIASVSQARNETEQGNAGRVEREKESATGISKLPGIDKSKGLLLI